MSLSRVKVWAAAEVLTASDLNTEFNNILSNALTLISPLTGNLDLDGNTLILDSDADTSIDSSTGNRVDLTLGGTEVFRFNTVATAVNGIDFTASATGNSVSIVPFGTDTNVGINITSKAAGDIVLTTTGDIVLTTTGETYSTTVSANEIIKMRVFS